MESVAVVIGASEPGQSLHDCLIALEPQRDDQVEVIVCEARPSSAAARERFPWAQFVELSGALVPMLWRDGIDRATGEIVVLTIAQMEPAPDWIAAIREQQQHAGAVGGAIEPGSRLRIQDWAEYFCRYARDMLPFEPRESTDLAGDNAAYRRELLEHNRELYRDGFWEPDIHRKLKADGVLCWHSPALVVRQGRSFGWRAFVRQRLHHGRAYGHQRGVRFSKMRNLIGVLASPLVPFLMTYRVVHEVRSRRRLGMRLLLALPMIFLFNLAWACAEALGHLDMVLGRAT
jgi:hypothetical protein